MSVLHHGQFIVLLEFFFFSWDIVPEFSGFKWMETLWRAAKTTIARAPAFQAPIWGLGGLGSWEQPWFFISNFHNLRGCHVLWQLRPFSNFMLSSVVAENHNFRVTHFPQQFHHSTEVTQFLPIILFSCFALGKVQNFQFPKLLDLAWIRKFRNQLGNYQVWKERFGTNRASFGSGSKKTKKEKRKEKRT